MRQRNTHSAATRSDRWGSDGTACALEWLNLVGTKGTDKRRRGKRLGYGAERMLVYSKGDIGVGRDIKGDEKTEFS